MEIDTLPLHDATLKAVEFDWAASTCTVYLATSALSNCALIFAEVSEVALPKKQPWGPSSSVNTATARDAGIYEIEMQSGDILRIAASNIAFDADAKPRRSI